MKNSQYAASLMGLDALRALHSRQTQPRHGRAPWWPRGECSASLWLCAYWYQHNGYACYCWNAPRT